MSAVGYHRHKCDTCDTIWEHSDDSAGIPHAHSCPNCGDEQTWKYYEPGTVEAQEVEFLKNDPFVLLAALLLGDRVYK